MFTEEKDSYKRVRQVITIVWELLQQKNILGFLVEKKR